METIITSIVIFIMGIVTYHVVLYYGKKNTKKCKIIYLSRDE